MAELRRDEDQASRKEKAEEPHGLQSKGEADSESADNLVWGKVKKPPVPQEGRVGASGYEGGREKGPSPKSLENLPEAPGEIVDEALGNKPLAKEKVACRPGESPGSSNEFPQGEGGEVCRPQAPGSSTKSAQERQGKAGQRTKGDRECSFLGTPPVLVACEKGEQGSSNEGRHEPAPDGMPPKEMDGNAGLQETGSERLRGKRKEGQLSKEKVLLEKHGEDNKRQGPPSSGRHIYGDRKDKGRSRDDYSSWADLVEEKRDRSPLKEYTKAAALSEEEEEEEDSAFVRYGHRGKIACSRLPGKKGELRQKEEKVTDMVRVDEEESLGEQEISEKEVEEEEEVAECRGDCVLSVEVGRSEDTDLEEPMTRRTYGPKKGASKSKEEKIVEAWKGQLDRCYDIYCDWLCQPPWEDDDLLKLWGFVVSRLHCGCDFKKANISKWTQGKCFDTLSALRLQVLGFLMGKEFESTAEMQNVKGLTLHIVERLLKRRKPRAALVSFPGWLNEEALVETFERVREYWQRVAGENPDDTTGLVKFFMVHEGENVPLSATNVAKWMLGLIEALKYRNEKRKEALRVHKSELRQLSEDASREAESREVSDLMEERRSARRSEETGANVGFYGQGASALAGPPQTGEVPDKRSRSLMGGRESPLLFSDEEGEDGCSEGGDVENRRGREMAHEMGEEIESGKGGRRGARTPPTPSSLPRRKKGRDERGVDTVLNYNAVDGEDRLDERRTTGVGTEEVVGAQKGVKETGMPGTGASFDLSQMQGMVTKRRETAEARDSDRQRQKTGPKKRLDWTGESHGPRAGLEASEGPDGGRGIGPSTPGMGTEEDFPPLDVGGRVQGKERNSSGLPNILAARASSGKAASRDETGEGGRELSSEKGQPRKSYASSVGLGSRSRTGGQGEALRDLIEDEEMLDAYYVNFSEERDERCRYVIRLRYRGAEEQKATREYVEEAIMVGLLNYPLSDVLAIIAPPGMREIDLCFPNERNYQKFWDRCKSTLRMGNNPLVDFDVVPLFRGETRVVTVAFRTTVIPEADVDRWLSGYGKVLMPSQRKLDQRGVWTGEFRAVIALERAGTTGRIQHLPKYFFLGADRGTTRYSQQPMACFQCGAYDHIRRDCMTPLCSKCGVRGHATLRCTRPVTCNLCRGVGHAYVWCPESAYNRKTLERQYEAERRAKEGFEKYEEQRRRERGGERKETEDEREIQRPSGRWSPTEERNGEWHRVKGRRKNKAGVFSKEEGPAEKGVTLNNPFEVLAQGEEPVEQREQQGEQDMEAGEGDKGGQTERTQQQGRKAGKKGKGSFEAQNGQEEKPKGGGAGGGTDGLCELTYEELQLVEEDFRIRKEVAQSRRIQVNERYKRIRKDEDKEELRGLEEKIQEYTLLLKAVESEKERALEEGRRVFDGEEQGMEVGSAGDPGGCGGPEVTGEEGRPSGPPLSSPGLPPGPRPVPGVGVHADTQDRTGITSSKATPHLSVEGVESPSREESDSGPDSEMESAAEELN